MPVLQSSCIHWVEYDSGRLHIVFHTGRSYTLRGVPYSVYLGLLRAPSPGRYFNRYLKGRF